MGTGARDGGRAPVNVVTLKWGDRYGPVFVNRLYRGVARHLSRPFRFLCFTDDGSGLASAIEAHPLPPLDLPESHARTSWLKLGLFADGLADMEGDCLFLDLDQIVVGGLDGFFDHRPGKRCIIHDWKRTRALPRKRPEIGNSSVFRWRAGTTEFILDRFRAEQDEALRRFGTAEQHYVTRAMGERYWWPAPWVRSFKRHAVAAFPLNLLTVPKLPAGTRILVFHGRPDPDQALAGWRAGRPHRRTRPAPWIADHWHDGPEDEGRAGAHFARRP